VVSRQPAKRAPAGRVPAKRATPSIHQVQAAAEGVSADRKVSLKGAEFAMADRIGLAPLILLAVAGSRGVDSSDAQGLVALHDVLNDCLAEAEHDRFWRHAVDTKADGDDLMTVVKDVIEALSARPTGSPSGSSAGRRRTSGNSKGSSRRTATPPEDGLTSVETLMGKRSANSAP
jgi:hypothetical protein